MSSLLGAFACAELGLRHAKGVVGEAVALEADADVALGARSTGLAFAGA